MNPVSVDFCHCFNPVTILELRSWNSSFCPAEQFGSAGQNMSELTAAIHCGAVMFIPQTFWVAGKWCYRDLKKALLQSSIFNY